MIEPEAAVIAPAVICFGIVELVSMATGLQVFVR